MSNFLRILLFCFSLFTTSAFAAFVQPDYFISSQSGVTGHFDSVSAAHTETVSAWKSAHWSAANCATFTSPSYSSTSGTWLSVIGGCGGGGFQYIPSCPSGSSFNKVKAMCEVAECPVGTSPDSNDECVPEPSQCEAGLKAGPYKFGAYVQAGGFMLEDPSPPTASCFSGCQYLLDFKNSCYTGNSGNYCLRTYTSSGVTCDGSGDGTGSGSSGDGDGPDAPPAEPSEYDENGDPKPDPEEPYPCTKRTDAEGRQTLDCSPPRDDSHKCPNGYVWTGTFCAKPPKPPTDPTDPTDPSNPGDGGSDGSGDEKGLAKDSTLKSIEGKIDTTNSKLTGIDGKLGASNTLLQGIKDAIGNIPGGGGGNNPGEGEGEEEPKVANGLGCSQDLDCSGDPIQCATLRINKEHLCQTQLTAEAEQQIKSVFEGEENQLETKEVSVDSVFTDGLNASRWLPSTCPTPESVTVFGRSYSISWQPLCTFASALSALIVAMASIFFIVYLGKGLKGS